MVNPHVEPDFQQEQSSHVHRVRPNQQAEVPHFDHCAVFFGPANETIVNLPGNQNVPGIIHIHLSVEVIIVKKES